MSKNAICLKSLSNTSDDLYIDNLEKAIDSLDELGLCINWGVIVNNEKGNHMTFLVYEGWTYRRSFERFVQLPFDEDSENFASLFQSLLEKIFTPFLTEDSKVYRSLISVAPGSDFAGQECFFVSLMLIFDDKDEKPKSSEIIQKALDEKDDSNENVSGKIFYLD